MHRWRDEALKLNKFSWEMISILKRMPHLTILNLMDNALTVLPEAIDNLEQLTKLNLDQNLLSALPATIGNLWRLERLSLRDNPLTALPKTIGKRALSKKLCTSDYLVARGNKKFMLIIDSGNGQYDLTD